VLNVYPQAWTDVKSPLNRGLGRLVHKEIHREDSARSPGAENFSRRIKKPMPVTTPPPQLEQSASRWKKITPARKWKVIV
jgi:hypothetical protein